MLQATEPVFYSAASLESLRAKPGRALVTSEDAGWSSLLMHVIELPACVEPFETLPSPDHLVTVVKKGVYDIESASSRSSRKTQYRPGRGGLTAAMNSSRLRWSSTEKEPIESIQMFLPALFVDQAIEEYRRPGSKAVQRFPDTLSFNDPVISTLALALVEDTTCGVPDLQAESAARFLVARLLLRCELMESSRHLRSPGVLTDKRLERVLSYMQANLSAAISLDELAKEAAISPFHFSRVFKSKIGCSPTAYLVQLRMERAQHLFTTSEMPIGDIARKCGYPQSGYFAACFRKQFGSAPGEYRADSSRTR